MDQNNTQLAVPGAAGGNTALAMQSPFSGGLSMGQATAIGRAWWRQSVAIFATIVVLTGLITLILPKTYTSTATLMVNFDVNDPLAGKEFPVSLQQTYMSTQLDLLQNPDVLLKVVDNLKLTQNEKYTDGFKGDVRALPDFIIKNMVKKLEIRQGQFGSQLIYVTYSSYDPQDAAAVANEIVQVYFDKSHERQTGPAAENAQRYTAELKDLRDKVETTRQKLDEFRTSKNMVDVQAKADIDIAILNELEHKLLDAQNARRSAEARGTSDQSVSSSVLGSSMVQQLKTQLSTQQARLAQLRETLGPKHPEVIALQSEIASTRTSLQAEIGRYASSNSAEVSSARQLEAKLQAATDAQRKKLLDVRRLQDEGSKYQMEFETAQAAYKKALEGYDAVMIASSGQYRNVNFVSRATPPLKPAKPKLSVNLLVGAVLGALLGFGIPFGREMLTRRVRCRDDLERDHGIPVLVEFDPMPALRNL